MAKGSVVGQQCCDIKITEGVPSAVLGNEFTDIMVNKPECCEVVLQTSAGNITLKKSLYLYNKEFKCPLKLDGVTHVGCDESDVWITLINE